MTPDVVVDLGNTRIKWGLCGRSSAGAADVLRVASLPDDPVAWVDQLAAWQSAPPLAGRSRLDWVLAGVEPLRLQRLRHWLTAHGHLVTLLDRVMPSVLQVNLDQPPHAGIDRLLNAVAARGRLAPGRGAVLLDAGSAVTADWLDEGHVFQGGAIFPGLDLMAEALHRRTALLPAVAVAEVVPDLPGKSTVPAMQVGLFLAVSGGIREAVRRYAERARTPPRIFFTGGQAPFLARAMGIADPTRPQPAPWDSLLLWPEQTLVGVLRSAEALP